MLHEAEVIMSAPDPPPLPPPVVAPPVVVPPPVVAPPPVLQGASHLPLPPPTLGDDPALRMILPVGRSGWAIAAGYLGLFAVLGIFAPLALLAGILAVRDINAHPGKHGMGRAIFGIIMGTLGTVLLVVMVVSIAASKKPG